MAKLHAIGSVVAIDGRRFVVIGQRLTRDGENVGAGYVLVPYPLGFVDADSLAVVPASRVSEIVAEGFESDTGADHLAQFEEFADALADTPYSEYASSVQLLQDFAREGGING